METSASATISTEQKLRNLVVAVDEAYLRLRKEGRYFSASHVDAAVSSLNRAIEYYGLQTPGHD